MIVAFLHTILLLLLLPYQRSWESGPCKPWRLWCWDHRIHLRSHSSCQECQKEGRRWSAEILLTSQKNKRAAVYQELKCVPHLMTNSEWFTCRFESVTSLRVETSIVAITIIPVCLFIVQSIRERVVTLQVHHLMFSRLLHFILIGWLLINASKWPDSTQGGLVMSQITKSGNYSNIGQVQGRLIPKNNKKPFRPHLGYVLRTNRDKNKHGPLCISHFPRLLHISLH